MSATRKGRQGSLGRYPNIAQQHSSTTLMPDLLLSHQPEKCRRQNTEDSLTKNSEGVPSEFESDGIPFVDVPRKVSAKAESKSSVADLTVDDILKESDESVPDQVHEINLRSKKLKIVPLVLKNFTKVRALDLSANKITLIENLFNNKDLRELKLYDNVLRDIYGLDEFKSLHSLQLQHNQIGKLSRGLLPLKTLKQLRLDNNCLLQIDVKELASLVMLTSLDISFNKLQDIRAISCLTNLEELNASSNSIWCVADLSRCKMLRDVNLSNNKVADISGIKGIPKLQILNLSHNELHVAKNVGKHNFLENLFLSHNFVRDLGWIVDAFPAVEVLEISDNHLEDMDKAMQSLKQLPNLCEVFMSGNSFAKSDTKRIYSISEIQMQLPNIEVIDGAVVKKSSASNSAPLMRPMSAASDWSNRVEKRKRYPTLFPQTRSLPTAHSNFISIKTVENQLKAMTDSIETIENRAQEWISPIQNFQPPSPPCLGMPFLKWKKCGAHFRDSRADTTPACAISCPNCPPTRQPKVAQETTRRLHATPPPAANAPAVAVGKEVESQKRKPTPSSISPDSMNRLAQKIPPSLDHPTMTNSAKIM